MIFRDGLDNLQALSQEMLNIPQVTDLEQEHEIADTEELLDSRAESSKTLTKS